MVLRGYPRGDVEKLAEFGHRVGLVTTLSGLGFGNLGPEELEVVAEAVSGEVPGVSPAEVARAVREVSRVGAEVAARVPPRRFGK
jgi:glycerol dehydrogenase-like iron-containing ADH family enzyme